MATATETRSSGGKVIWGVVIAVVLSAIVRLITAYVVDSTPATQVIEAPQKP